MGEEGTVSGGLDLVTSKKVTEEMPQKELEIFKPMCFGAIGVLTEDFIAKYKKMEKSASKLLSPEYIRALTVLKHGGHMDYFNWAVNAGLDPKTMETMVKNLVNKYHLVDKKPDLTEQYHDLYHVNENGLQILEAAKILYQTAQKVI
jgi:hypothetical protein